MDHDSVDVETLSAGLGLAGKSFRPEDVPVEHMDYDYVGKCTNYEELKAILQALQSGREGRYPDLERATEERLVQLMPEKERITYERLKSKPTLSEEREAEQDLADYLRDMKSMDRSVMESGASAPVAEPPVRGRASASLSTASEESKGADAHSEGKQKKRDPKALSFADYTKMWDAYDEKAAIAKIEEEEELEKRQKVQREEQQQKAQTQKQIERQKEMEKLKLTVDPDSLPRPQRALLARREKEKGNECFHAKEYDDAILFYSRSLIYDPNNAAVLANRSVANLQLKHYHAATDDASLAIAADRMFMKGWMRRAQAHMARGKYMAAVDDIQEALGLEPGNARLMKMLKEATAKFEKAEGVSVEEAKRSGRPLIEETSSEPKKTRVMIEEDSDEEEGGAGGGSTRVMIEESDEEEEEDGGAAAGGSTRVMIEEDSEEEEEEEAPTRAVAVGSSTRVMVEEEDEEREQPSASSTRLTIEEDESEEEDVEANVTSVSSQPPSSVQGEYVDEAESHKSSPAPERAAEGGGEEKKKVEEGEVTPSVIGEETAAEIRSKMKCPPLPQTAYEFECHIEAVAKSLPVAVEYLKALSKLNLRKTFRRCPEPVALGGAATLCARALRGEEGVSLSDGDAEALGKAFSGLSKVREFDMALMMIPGADMTNAREAADALIERGAASKKSVAKWVG